MCDANEEIERILAEQASLPRDEQRDRHVLEWVMNDLEGHRFAEFHAERCAICGRPTGRIPDHCHQTGQVRGYLCQSCNVLEGRSEYPIFDRYRAAHPAMMLEIYVMYSGSGWQNGWSFVQHRGGSTRGIRPRTPWPAWSVD